MLCSKGTLTLSRGCRSRPKLGVAEGSWDKWGFSVPCEPSEHSLEGAPGQTRSRLLPNWFQASLTSIS